jgi:predicted metal-dependent hydrolase
VPEDCKLDIPFNKNFHIENIKQDNQNNFWDEVNNSNTLTDKNMDIYHVPQNGIGLPNNKNCPFVITLHDIIPYKMPDTVSEQYLKIFVIAYAKQHLPVYLDQTSQVCNLSFGKCTIRQPRTRWGSCSARHDIMLNSGLVLFPENITRYVCVHELAHTKHFDHSPHFWAEVQKHDANFQQHRKMLKTTPMPWWWGVI